MKTITTSTCIRQGNIFGGLIGQIVFKSKQNSTQVVGRNVCGGASSATDWSVPDNAIIIGVRTWLGKGDNNLNFPGVVAIQWLYYDDVE